MWSIRGQVGVEVLVGAALALAMSVVGEVGAATDLSAGTSQEPASDAPVRWYESLSSGLRATAPKALDFMGSHAAAALVVAMAMVATVVVLTWWWTRRGLAQRVRLVALPTESFDPEDEEVLRLATQLARTRRAVHRFGGRRADAVRLRLVALQGGRVVQLIEGPRRAEAVLRLGGYAEVELLPPETLEKATLVHGGAPGDDDPADASSGDEDAADVDGVESEELVG
jgi:hypothetical protein